MSKNKKENSKISFPQPKKPDNVAHKESETRYNRCETTKKTIPPKPDITPSPQNPDKGR